MGVEQNGKTVVLKHDSGASVEVYLFGATVTSWKVDGEEKFFLSSKSSLDSSKPIRGGIPIVFPIFGAPPSSPPEYAALKQHGFARTADWSVDKVIMDRPEGVSVRFVAPPPPSEFKHSYKLAFVVTLAAHQLSTDLHIINEGKEEFQFQALLHNYLAVPDAKKLSVEGIDKGTRYKDKTQNFKELIWPGEPLTITQETDAVFQKLETQELKLDYGNGKGLNVRFRGFEDCTIWNPQEKGKTMADMEDGGWERYICIEPGFVREFKYLQPGEEFLGQQVLTIF
ncbi:galactose mutarotase-like domain-containing protein [Kockovaella imperatae]|uniref:Glucose-6-phosphate 1-epimerase n=1 Tax=Kockovaella imperatae TaxID=4999 RepID=A0A1Y1U9M8_9TREE|nr:galactose mutarotase-like domain-containing protein [Kockovaella imperatae]ORX34740.1 galactose mutarotase-like domain-containing protein [Kockovaella imperatae]